MLHTVSSRGVAAARSTRQASLARSVARPVRLSRTRVATTEAKTKEEKKSKKEEEEEYSFDGPDVAPSTQQVQEFLSTLCDETEIAEIELKMGSFALKVRRDVEGPAAPPPAAPSPVADMGVRAPLPAMAPAPAYVSVDGADLSSDEGAGGGAAGSADETAVFVTSPKVGIFRRGKYAAGKRIGKALCVEGPGATLKRGQTVGYVEQLGTFVPVEAPQAGEVVSILGDGEAVEYQQEIVRLAPFFGGHIIGEAKYA